MDKKEMIAEIMRLPAAEQREIFEMLRERLGAAADAGAVNGQKVPEKKRVDPWGSVYSELAKTFRRPAAR
jgi:hypothetical protein